MSTIRSKLWINLLVVTLLTICSQRFVYSEQPRHYEAVAQMVWEEERTNLFAMDEVDLDRDGIAESIVTYPAGVHASHVRVLKWNHGTPTILFESGSNTPNIDFKMIGGVPTIIFEQSNYGPDYTSAHRYKEVYQWNGKTFASMSKDIKSD